MQHLRIKDVKKRFNLKKLEAQRTVLAFLRYNLLNKKQTRICMHKINSAFLTLTYTKKNYLNKKSKVSITSRCVVTNRSRGVIRKFGLSRNTLSNFMHFGLIPGYKKAVW